jgi:hypothetical protein
MPTHSCRYGDAAEQCWRILGPAIGAWRAGQVPMDQNAAGSLMGLIQRRLTSRVE